MLGCIGLLGLLLTGSSSIFGVGYGTLAVELQGSLPLKLLEGLVTMNDLKRALAAGRNDQTLEQVATHNVVHVHPDHTLATAIIKLGRQGISQLPVVSRKDSAKILGILTMHDIAEALSKESQAGESKPEVRSPSQSQL